MPLLPLSLAALWAPIAFGAAAPAMGAGRLERVVLGKWFDGSKRRDVEEAIWLSPWGALRQGWSWEDARRRFDGSLTFGVRLLALERQDPLEFGGDTEPGDDPSRALFNLEATDYRGRSAPLPVEIVVRWTQRGREPSELLRVPWLAFLYGDPPDRLPLSLGRNQIAVYEVRSPVTPLATAAVSFRLSVTTARRTRVAVFKRWPG